MHSCYWNMVYIWYIDSLDNDCYWRNISFKVLETKTFDNILDIHHRISGFIVIMIQMSVLHYIDERMLEIVMSS